MKENVVENATWWEQASVEDQDLETTLEDLAMYEALREFCEKSENKCPWWWNLYDSDPEGAAEAIISSTESSGGNSSYVHCWEDWI